MKIFGGDTITKVYNSLGADEDMPIELKLISRAVENAQKKVEGRNFTIRKNVLKYDDVMNAQREIIYAQRREVLNGENIHDNIMDMIHAVAEATVQMYVEPENNEVNVEALNQDILNTYGIDMLADIKEHVSEPEKISEELIKKANAKYIEKETEIGSEEMRELVFVLMDNKILL